MSVYNYIHIYKEYICTLMRLSQLNQYKMNIKTNLIEEYVNFVDTANKRNKNLWIYIILHLFIVFILIVIIIFLLDYINE